MTRADKVLVIMLRFVGLPDLFDLAFSLCETCALMREVITAKGSRFLLCPLSKTDPAYPTYQPQPVVR